ncbi:hypothetical protein [Glutamicibacter creatinolyticus]|uniref:hypothetical protein n=1 Tax=Glutamicibacter creatinolyticus TaxID=162496 RepID=UPI0032166846
MTFDSEIADLEKRERVARERVNELLQQLSNVALAKVLRAYFDPATPADEKHAIGVFYREHLEEARRRVENVAKATSDAEWEAFKVKYGMSDDMPEEELDAIYDGMTDEEFERESPRGEVWHLIDALESANS